MSTLAPVTAISSAWTLVYDASVSGDFIGSVSTTSSAGGALIIASALPSTSLFGGYFTGSQMVSLSKAAGDKLYARAFPGPGLIVLDAGMSPLPIGLFAGTRAITQQNYTEANVKVGRQYEASWNVPALGNGANADVSFVTGSKPIIVKSRIVKFNGTSLVTRVYRGPTFTPGMNIPYANLNDRNPVTGGVVVTLGPDVTATGTEIASPSYDIGTQGQGNSTFGTYSVYGGERVLRPNTAYLLRINNDSGATQRVSGYISWYEGDTDLPL